MDTPPKRRTEIEAPPSELRTDIPASGDENRTETVRVPVMPLDIPGAGDELRTGQIAPVPVVLPDIPSADDEVSRSSTPKSPQVGLDIPAAGDEVRAGKASRLPELSPDIPGAGDESRLHRGSATPGVSVDIPTADDDTRLARKTNPPVLPADIPSADDEVSVSSPPRSPAVPLEIPAAGDEHRSTEGARSPAVPLDIPAAGDEHRIVPTPKLPVIPMDIPAAGDEVRLTPGLREKLFREIPDAGDDSRYKRREFSLTGKWLPKGDPLNIGADNFATLQNFRPTDWGLEGVGGYSRINTAVTGGKITSGIQLVTPYAVSSYTLVQNHETVGGARTILQNRNVPPNTGNFLNSYAFIITYLSNDVVKMNSTVMGVTSATVTVNLVAGTYATGSLLAAELQTRLNTTGTLCQGLTNPFAVSYSAKKFTITMTGGTASYVDSASTAGDTLGFTANQGPSATLLSNTEVSNDTPLYAEESGAGLARFAHLPGGNIGMCDGKANRIWAGDEMPVGAFLVTTKQTVDASTLHNARIAGISDLTDAVNNDLTDENNLVTITKAVTYGDATTDWEIDITTGHDGYVVMTATGGTSPAFIANGCKVGDYITISGFTDAGNNGTFMIDYPGLNAVGAAYVTFYNPNAVAVAPPGEDPIVVSSVANMFFVGSTRKLSSAYFTVNNANATAGTMAVYCRSESGWSSDIMTTDNTLSSGKTLGQSGSIVFSGTSARPFLVNEQYLFFYLFVPTACNAKISQVTVSAAIQSTVDIWDGVTRTCLAFLVRRNGASNVDTMSEFTLEVVAASAEATPLGGEIGSLNYNAGVLAELEFIVVVFSERQAAFHVVPFAGKAQATARTTYVDYWNGQAWSQVSGLVDGTLDSLSGTKPIADAGYISWDYIPQESEKIRDYKGHKGYAYRIRFSGDTSGTNPEDVVIDMFRGVPCYKDITALYVFPHMHRNRAMWCGCASDGEENRVDYSSSNDPDVYNGDDASGHANQRSLYFGGNDALTGAVELFQLYGDAVQANSLFFKNTETHLLTGDSPDEFKIFRVSGLIGCPAPLTITQGEVALDGRMQNVILWMSDKGPMMYQNHSLVPIPGIEPYFDQSDSRCVNAAYITESRAWHGADYREWNLQIPSGATATGNNVWLVLDLWRMKWYERVHTNDLPIGGFPVRDAYGNSYVYGYTAGGYLLRLEYGLQEGGSGTGADITNTVKTADVLLTQSMWDDVGIRTLKVLFEDNVGTMAISHYGDGNEIATASTGFPTAQSMAKYGYRYRNLIVQAYQGTARGFIRAVSHAFKFVTTGCTAEKPKLIGWGVLYDDFKEDIKDGG